MASATAEPIGIQGVVLQCAAGAENSASGGISGEQRAAGPASARRVTEGRPGQGEVQTPDRRTEVPNFLRFGAFSLLKNWL